MDRTGMYLQSQDNSRDEDPDFKPTLLNLNRTLSNKGYGTGTVPAEVLVCCLGVSNEVSRSLEGGGSCDQAVGGLYKKGKGEEWYR